MDTTFDAAKKTRARTSLVATIVGAVVMLALALALPGLVTPAASAASPRLAGPAQFARVVAQKGTVTIDVRGPGSSFIPGTDLSIAFDKLTTNRAKLPPATTRLAVYCRSGRRSAIAVAMLVGLGYRDIVELRGGTTAWAEAGRALLGARGWR